MPSSTADPEACGGDSGASHSPCRNARRLRFYHAPSNRSCKVKLTNGDILAALKFLEDAGFSVPGAAHGAYAGLLGRARPDHAARGTPSAHA
ncbi:hypothetical protein ACVWZD_008923 [Streptomyces sp. TE3672]